MVLNRKIISKSNMINNRPIILEFVWLWRPLLVPVYELGVDVWKVINLVKSKVVIIKTRESSKISLALIVSSLVLSLLFFIVEVVWSSLLEAHLVHRIIDSQGFDLEPWDVEGSRSQKNLIHGLSFTCLVSQRGMGLFLGGESSSSKKLSSS